MESKENQGNAILNLKPAEISNPLLVIKDFFSDDSLPGHLERLQKWRSCVLEEHYFKGDKGSPSELLYFYKLNVCLLEAAYLLKDRLDLNFKEPTDPLFVFKQIYQDYDLSAYQGMLYEWLEFGLSARATNEAITPVDLIRVYENLQRLYGASWNVNQRFANTSLIAHQASIEQSADSLIGSPNVALYKLDSTIGSPLQETITKIVAKIKEKVSSVQAIIYLG
ncbi:hypothetical protein [Mucilaginibacter psychrotolerans]|uniref:Uncharacterized protein n=1 Tax=Mucilaginibacter psychrotolerans TaxID=1524096 RepID=A0A4Y8SAZ5_9SPHI|nr:hypothetical protein [Mucilaginibacter psychrotolerans]TFF36148.1 hypothetical protein E2R66_16520 [Mucilaginibacter psychrotolerans]